MVIDGERLRAIVYGGAFLGAGGGGSIAAGFAAGREALALGTPRIVPLTHLTPDATLVTVSAVGTARGTSAGQVDCRHFLRALALFGKLFDRRVDGLIASEVGPLAVTYGWRESIVTGIPVIDAPCNGRAHPLFVMGSLGLHRAPRVHLPAVAVAGREGTANFLELTIHANVTSAARIVRGEADRARTSFAVVRNPVSAGFVRRRGAVGALAHAFRLGCAILESRGRPFEAHVSQLARTSGGHVLGTGTITATSLRDLKGFTLGRIDVRCGARGRLSVPVCNEYMLVLRDGRPLAAFPDVIALIDRESGLPLASSEASSGRVVAIVVVPREKLILGAAMADLRLLQPIESLLKMKFPRAAAARPATDRLAA
jgi:DUF917 family protein